MGDISLRFPGLNWKKNCQADQEPKKAAQIPIDKIQAVLIVPDLIEEMPQPCYTKEIGVKIGG